MRLSPDARTHIALVVDDQATARQRMSSILADAGWRVSTAGSAAEALDKARTERPADQVWARMQGGKALIGKPYSDAQVLDALRFAAR